MEKNFQTRLENEFNELSLKVSRLSNFMESPKWDDIEPQHQTLLDKQLFVMQQYLVILEMRIKLLLDENLKQK